MLHKITGSTDSKYLGMEIDPSQSIFSFEDGFTFEPAKRIIFIGGVALQASDYTIICQEI